MSDEIEMGLLRELGRELEHEPPTTLQSQRTRLLDRAARRRRMPRRVYGWPLLAVVASGTAGLVALPTLVLNSGHDGTLGTGARHRTSVVNVPPPDPASLIRLPANVRKSVLKIHGTAPSCAERTESSGFVYAPERVLTVAHSIAGTRGAVEVSTQDGLQYRGQVVLLDMRRDIAVIAVPGLRAAPLPLAQTFARDGESVVFLGYPKDQTLSAGAARIRSQEATTNADLTRTRAETEVYSFRGTVEPGDSGGPLVALDGRVYGMVFFTALDTPQTGYAVNAPEIAPDAASGIRNSTPVATGNCVRVRSTMGPSAPTHGK